MADAIRGGPAAVFGILYQVIGALHRATIRLSNVTSDDANEIEEYTLTLEPERGGDLQICSRDHRVIEQWKTRRTCRPWTVREVMTDVVPNLYLAANNVDESCTFRFVSNGGVADWSKIAALSLRIKAHATTVQVADVAPAPQIKTQFLARGKKLSDDEFIDEIVDAVEQKLKNEKLEEARSTIRCKLLFVLANLEIKSNQTIAVLQSEINQVLALHVNHEEDVTDKRNELVGRLLNLSKTANTRIDPVKFLRETGLSSVSLADWPRVRGNLAKCASHDTTAVLRYEQDLDVRPRPKRLGERCTIFFGESGTGKSWRLGAMAETCAEDIACVVIRSRQDLDKDLEAAAQIVNYQGICRERPIHFTPLCHKIRRHAKPSDETWLWLLIDDVQSPEELRDILSFDWTSLGVRIAASCSSRLAAGLRNAFKSATWSEVGVFTQRELRRYLDQRKRTWRIIRPDVRELIQRPQLASIYCDVALDNEWNPENEYELFRRNWERLSSDHRQINHPADMPALRKLAGTLVTENVIYPWEYSDCQSCGLLPESVSRLERIGWLTLEDGRILFAHARLLNWAVAEFLADRCHRANPSSEVAKVICIIGQISKNGVAAGQYLGHVPMDFLWLLSSVNHLGHSHVHEVISELEATDGQPYQPESLYRQLSTIGPRIIEPLARRLQLVADDEHSTHPYLVSQTLLDIAEKRYQDRVSRSAARFLNPSVPAIADCACRVLKVVPTGDAADKLWEYYVTFLDDPCSQHLKRFSSTEPLGALIAVTKKNVGWIDAAIQKEKVKTRVQVLGMLLWRVPDQAADEIWRRHRERLLDAMAEDYKELACAIERFQDTRAAASTIAHLGSLKDWQRSFLLQAISIVCPTELLDAFEAEPRLMISRSHAWALPLIYDYRDRFNLIISRVIVNDRELIRHCCKVYWHCPNEMTEDVVVHLVDELIDRCRQITADQDSDNDNVTTISTICDALCGITQPMLLSLVRDRNTPLADALTSFLERKPNETASRSFRRDRRRFLLKVGGDAFARHVNGGLEQDCQMARAQALDWASVVPNLRTTELLRQQMRSAEMYEHGVPKEPYLQRNAATVLASFASDEEVIESILRHDGYISSIAKARANFPCMSDEHCRPAWQATLSGAEDDRIKAWHALAVTGRRDYAPRLLEAIEKLDQESAEARAVLVSLVTLRADTPDAVDMYTRHLHFPKTRWLAFQGLLNSGHSDIENILSAYIGSFDTEAAMTSDERLALLLGEYEPTKELAAEFAWKVIHGGQYRSPFRDLRFIRLLGTLQREDVNEFLYEESHPSIDDEYVHGQRAAAIEALSMFDKSDAFEAAHLALLQAKLGRERYPELLVEFDPDSAVPVLVERLMDEREGMVRRAIAVALRRSHLKVEELILKLSRSEQPRRRSVAAWLLGWFPSSFLPKQLDVMLAAETTIDVRSRILGSIFMRKNQDVASCILALLPKADIPLQWCYAECLFELVPPEMLGASADDELWIFRISESLPYLLQTHIASRYENLMRNTTFRSEINDFLTGP